MRLPFIVVVTVVALSVTIGLLVRWMRTSRFVIRGKVFLITGGSRGLGLVIAREVCARGAKVVLLARSLEELARAEDDLLKRGAQVLAIACDLQDPGTH
jgi:short-subunit dehydrogenase